MAQLFRLRMVRISDVTEGYVRDCTAAKMHLIPPPPAPQDPVPASIVTWAVATHEPGDIILAQWTTRTLPGFIITEWEATRI